MTTPGTIYGFTIIEDLHMTERVPRTVARTWSERLLSLTPWRATKRVLIELPSLRVEKVGENTLRMHPQMARGLREAALADKRQRNRDIMLKISADGSDAIRHLTDLQRGIVCEPLTQRTYVDRSGFATTSIPVPRNDDGFPAVPTFDECRSHQAVDSLLHSMDPPVRAAGNPPCDAGDSDQHQSYGGSD